MPITKLRNGSPTPLLPRREFLKLSGLAALAPGCGVFSFANAQALLDVKADYTLRIARGNLELAPKSVISTTLYNNQFPGPLLRFSEGKRAIVDIYNDTQVAELAHWHGQTIPSDVDGAAEEGTPAIPAHGMRRISFVPRPAGFRFLHTHVVAGADLAKGTYSGQAAPVYIEPKTNAGAYDREMFLTLKEFVPSLSHGGDMDMDFLAGESSPELQAIGKAADAKNERHKEKGFEVNYRSFAINGKMLGFGEPIRVRAGERVLFHVLNASAGEIRSLALPGHVFHVVALDGNPVPTPSDVPVLWLGTAERVSAIVEMRHPGVWVLGDLDDGDRKNGMGIVIEYAGRRGAPTWRAPEAFKWDYSLFGRAPTVVSEPDETIEMLIVKNNGALGGFNEWTLNGEAFSMVSMKPLHTVQLGRRYRLRLRNASDDIHPLHLHRHTFELTRIAGKPTSGVMKDVVMLGGYQEAEFDFVADNPGLTLFHCHQQLHMDFGFMALFKYA
jgi:FtsP/CotA-like multicopper oxidase with cupredoxin domain